MTESPTTVLTPDTDHEQIVFCQDRASGLKAVIALHSTALGPALGGTRFHPYATEAEAVDDVRHLARGMTYKNALAGLDLGGGKAVIIGDPATVKSEALLRAYGRFVESLGGRYITACDVGTYVEDMDLVHRETRWAVGKSLASGGAGDSSVLTAFGVFQGMRAVAERVWGESTLAGRRVGIAGVGKVGSRLAKLLLDDGAHVVVTDVDDHVVTRLTTDRPDVDVATDTDALLSSGVDIYAPCALGGALNDDSVALMTKAGVRAVCGAANNQLDHPGIEKVLDDAGVLYAPDYVVNSGGVIQVADELHDFSFERAKAQATKIFDTTGRILALASEEAVPPAVAADRLAETRIAEVSRLRTIRLGA